MQPARTAAYQKVIYHARMDARWHLWTVVIPRRAIADWFAAGFGDATTADTGLQANVEFTDDRTG